MEICVGICMEELCQSAIEGVGIFLNGNPCTIIVSCYSPSNASDKMDINTFDNELSFLVRLISKHNGQKMSGDMNIYIDRNGNNKFWLHNPPNRNDEYLVDFFFRSRTSLCAYTLNIKQKEKENQGHIPS